MFHLLKGDITISVTFSLNLAGFTIILLRLLIINAECVSGSKALNSRGSELWNSRVIFIIAPLLMWNPSFSPLKLGAMMVFLPARFLTFRVT